MSHPNPPPSPPPQAGSYRVVYADPPWRFDTFSDRGKGRSAEAHYDCLSLAEIKQLPVAEWAAPDSVLLMWVTDPLLPRALEVIQARGFTYKTVGFYWVKLNKRAVPVTLGDGPMLGERDFFTGSPGSASGPGPTPSPASWRPAASPNGSRPTYGSC